MSFHDAVVILDVKHRFQISGSGCAVEGITNVGADFPCSAEMATLFH